MSDQSALAQLSSALTNGSICVVDLTQTLSEDTPVIVIPSEFGQCAPFSREVISRYDDRGISWYWSNFTVGEHTGTHFDAPAHWVTGKDLVGNTLEAIPPKDLLAPAVVIDCSTEASNNPDFLLEVEHVDVWERQHGRIPKRSWVLFRTDWSKREGDDYTNRADDGAHTPGPSPAAIRHLIEERDILGFGVETIGTDAGQAFLLEPRYPAHTLLHGAGRYGLQCLENLDKLPATGSIVLTAPLKIRDRSGSPLRVIALVDGQD